MTITKEQFHLEEEYFVAISRYLLTVVGVDEDRVQETAHRIMDVWTFDDVLDTDSLDAVMAAWPSENDIWENDYND